MKLRVALALLLAAPDIVGTDMTQNLDALHGAVDQDLAQLVVAMLADRLINGGVLDFMPNHQNRPGLFAKIAATALCIFATVGTSVGCVLNHTRSPELFDLERHDVSSGLSRLS